MARNRTSVTQVSGRGRIITLVGRRRFRIRPGMDREEARRLLRRATRGRLSASMLNELIGHSDGEGAEAEEEEEI